MSIAKRLLMRVMSANTSTCISWKNCEQDLDEHHLACVWPRVGERSGCGREAQHQRALGDVEEVLNF
jgi:hypothetical protein